MEEIKLNSEEWWLQKHKELVSKTSITKNDVLDFDTLNKHLSEYGGDCSFSIKESSDAWLTLDRLKKGFEIWYNGKFSECRTELIKEGEKSPVPAKLVEVKVTTKYEKEYTQWNEKISEAEYHHRILSEFTKIMDGMGYVYHNLSENMRFDMSTSADRVEERLDGKKTTMMTLRRKEG